MENDQKTLFHSGSPRLPTTFSILSGLDSSNLRVTVLGPISHLDISSLNPQSIFSKRTVFLLLEVTNSLQGSKVSRLKQFDEKGKFLEYGYLAKCGGLPNAYTMIDCGKKAWEESEKFRVSGDQLLLSEDLNQALLSRSAQDIIRWLKCEPKIDISRKEQLEAFSMKPPIPQAPPPIEKHSSYTISPQSESNPLSFLQSRYYTTLYSLTTPLSYFPKTALARFKIMCGNDNTIVKANLLSVYLTTEQLEERYNSKFGLESAFSSETVSLSRSSVFKYEAENRQLFISKNLPDSRNEELLRKLVLELKIREAQLQILVLMELMLAWPIEEEAFLVEAPLKHAKSALKSQKQSLVRRKGAKKKIIPTFLGVGVQDFANSPEKPVNKAVSELTLYTSLISLVDQMSIWDTLLGRVKGEKDESMYGFLAYVLVPFFNKQLPHIVLFIIQKVKELRPKLKIPKSRSSKRKLLLVIDLEANISDEPPVQIDDTEELPKKSSRFAKILLSSNQKPFLKRAATVGTELEPAFLLKRSKSNLGSKNLKRRQVDISAASNSTDAEEPKLTKLFVFGDARRIKSVSSSVALSEVTQVEATPRKENPSSSSMLTTMSAPISTSQILATPSNVRVVDMQQHILETPRAHQSNGGFAVPGGHGPSLLEQFARLAPPIDTNMKITSSPVRESVENTPELFLRSSVAIESSPLFAVTSSPVMSMSSQKKKPGERISMGESPFFRSNLNGLPPAKTGTLGGLFRTSKLVRKEKGVPSIRNNKSTQAIQLNELIISKPPPLTLTETDVDKLLAEKSEILELFEAPAKTSSQISQSLQKSFLSAMRSRTTQTTFESTDTDSDSDYEKLLSSVARPAIRKYSRR